jgi:hypothetical protein
MTPGKTKDDPAPVVVGRLRKDASLREIVEGLEREAVADFKVKLLHSVTLNAAAQEIGPGPTAAEKLASVKAILQRAVKSAEGIEFG